ncbi:MAG: tripartite tricarboxylate transporter substrate binding protein [Burkholderiaceae bacterium]|nr:tripartite tricarboxylate transporter substrate binding protein [Burkholderiaceae bacterium]
MKAISTALVLALAALASPLAYAQSFPDRPVRIIIPFPPGGATDTLARVVSQKMAKTLGQPVVIENRAGATGAIGSDAIAKAAPDGYNLLLATSSTHVIAPAINPRLPYDAARDFTPIAHLGSAAAILLVPNNSPAKTVRNLIDIAAKNPGRLNYGSSGKGSYSHLVAAIFQAKTNTFMTHIPYKGTAAVVPDMIGGSIDFMFESIPVALPRVREGQLRALGVTSPKRTALAPEFPAVAETVPGFESVIWYGLYGPKGMPADVIQRISAAANQALDDAEVKAQFARLGIDPAGGSAQQFAQMVAADTIKWKRVASELKVSLD